MTQNTDVIQHMLLIVAFKQDNIYIFTVSETLSYFHLKVCLSMNLCLGSSRSVQLYIECTNSSYNTRETSSNEENK